MKSEILEQELQKISPDLRIIGEIEWNSSNGGRCITDYSTEVKFSRVLTSEELVAVKKLFRETQGCPGWTPVEGYLHNEESALYRLFTCWDSSD